LDCPLCGLRTDAFLWESESVVAVRAPNGEHRGHTLVVLRRHALDYFHASPQERLEIWRAVEAVKALLDRDLHVDGYRIAFDIGRTTPHMHVHVIPQFGEARPEHRLTRGLDDPFAPHLFRDLDRARHADFAVAFLLPSGLTSGVLARVTAMLEREHSRVRILVGDYQDVTDPAALRVLLNLQEQVVALAELRGALELRIFETGADVPSFHPKAYLLYAGADRQPLAAYVGSSNLTATGLDSAGVEWNLRVVDGTAEVQRAFEELFVHPRSKVLTHAWVREYEQRRVPPQPGRRGPAEIAPPDEPMAAPPVPHSIQQEALDALEATREAGNRRGLVVLATGLGKTWLAAFDSTRARGFGRVLFVAHREEILRQAMATFAKIRPGDDLGLYTGEHKDLEADVLFASVMTLGRDDHLDRFDRKAFDYIVIDEFHHACASTYRNVLRHFEPAFLLGLTATPERTDGGDLLGLCDENLVYECALGEGIERGNLCPFHYFGVPDEVDYEQIPWKSRRFDEDELTRAVATTRRAENALEQLRAHGGQRTLGFCVSQRHADFMRDYFAEHTDLRVAAVHSGERSDPRQTSLERLANGELDVLFCVDMFNEGLDVPSIDTVLMLRPTESKIIWLQQLGRGLRKADGKARLNVIDYIGNHRVFLNKPEALLGAIGRIVHNRREVARILRARDFELPPGCEVTYDVEAIEILERLYPPSKGALAIREWYEDFRDANERRPTALEAYHCDYNPGAMRRDHGSWLGFVQDMGDLEAAELQALERDRAWLDELETTRLGSSTAIVVLQAMLDAHAFPGSIAIDALADGFARLAGRSAAIRREVGEALDDPARLRTFVREKALAPWLRAKDRKGRAFFVATGDAFATGPGIVGEESEALVQLCDELLDWRLARALDEARAGATFRVLRNASGNPILKIDRDTQNLPDGWAPVTIDGQRYRANFVKEFVNVVQPEGETKNVLPTLLRGWFGDTAGSSGTTHSVAQDRDAEGALVWRRAAEPEPDEGWVIRGNDGKEIDARFKVEERDGPPTVVVMSRGAGRNNAYAEGLELLLARLAAMGATVERIAIDTGGTKQLALERRTLAIPGQPFPIELTKATDVKVLRLKIARAGAAIGREPGAKGGGNPNKRLRIWIAGNYRNEVGRLLRDG
jgi:superfamily II DNA or RNA helicase/diadenosine tetraphosphate (Ap4A) HIT family hydrolase